MAAVGLKKGKATEWLLAPEPEGEELLLRKIPKSAFDLLKAGAGLDMVVQGSLSPQTFIEVMQSLTLKEVNALAKIMGMSMQALQDEINLLR